MSSYSQWFANRLVDDTITNDIELSPIEGYQNQALVSLEQAIQPIESLIYSLKNYVKVAKVRCYYPNEHGLTRDQSASVYLYTMEWSDNSFYRVLNAALRTKKRSMLKRWFLFLKLFDTALQKLPLVQQVVWRGIRLPLGEQCKKGDELIWWSISSCSVDVHVIENFLVANDTLFLIEALSARDVTGYTSYPDEHEVIFPPGLHLQVLADPMDHSGGLRIVHTRELPSVTFTENQAVQKHSCYLKIIPKCLQTYGKKYWLVIILTFIIIGLVISLSAELTKRKKNNVGSIFSRENSTVPSSTTTVSDLFQNITLNDTVTPDVTMTTVTAQEISDDTDEDKQLFGIQSANPDLIPNTEYLQELGVRIFRISVSWYRLEENGKNNISLSYLNKLDNLISIMEQVDIRILIYMIDTPCWASSSLQCDQLKYRPKDYNDYADAMTFLLKHYEKRIYAWEIWNEPNLSENWLRPECQLNNGSCPRASDLNDEDMLFIDLIGAQEYSQMVKITYEKMKSIDSNVIILAGSLAGGDVAYLNEMYQANIKSYFTALSMHPYVSSYRKPTAEDEEQYGPDECPSSKFWCFQDGVERIRQKMIEEMDESKSIWLTEFGFSSSSDFGGDQNRQMYYLERSMDIIQQQWPFAHVACYYEYSDKGYEAPRKGLFGLLDKNFIPKNSAWIFTSKTRYTTPTTSPTSQPTSITPSTIYPIGMIDTDRPYFSWPRVPYADLYYLHVNDNRVPSIEGRIDEGYSPVRAHCQRKSDKYCYVTPFVQFTKRGGVWWVTVHSNQADTSSDIVHAVLFTVK